MSLEWPKSVSLTASRPGFDAAESIRTFSGFKSRWTTFWEWMYCKPSTNCMKMCRASSASKRPRDTMWSNSVPPSISSMTRINLFWVSKTLNNCTILSCRSLQSKAISRFMPANACCPAGCRRTCSKRIIFAAKCRSPCLQRYTVAVAPCPMRSMTTKGFSLGPNTSGASPEKLCGNNASVGCRSSETAPSSSTTAPGLQASASCLLSMPSRARKSASSSHDSSTSGTAMAPISSHQSMARSK
mmetsp:Transcript_59216/g.137927  ORF Transcript_59216/g.137927 Transcript_59216/m.137927 type:complete len:243 (+) Transcript_59216:204-932(+)